MKPKTALLIILLAVVCLTVSGCFYLRLQQVKAQLSRFDDYYQISEGERFSIAAKEPVLLSADVIRIMETAPSRTNIKDQRLSFDYTLEKQSQPGQSEPNNYDITTTFHFDADKLSEVLIDRRFFVTMPKWMFIAMVKAFGNSQVDLHNRRLSASYHSESPDMHIPDVNEVLMLLGKPYAQESNTLTYKYKRVTQQPTEGQKDKSLSAVFTFDGQGRLIKCHSEFLGGPMELDFTPLLRFQEQTSAADSNSVKVSDTQK
jgi:hypothetical protein